MVFLVRAGAVPTSGQTEKAGLPSAKHAPVILALPLTGVQVTSVPDKLVHSFVEELMKC